MSHLLTAILAVALVPTSQESVLEEFERVRGRSKPAIEARKADFDFLLGDWEVAWSSQQWGAGRAFWSAILLPQGQVLDEYRVVGDQGQILYVTTTIRAYNAALDLWEIVGMNDGGGLQDTGTAQRVGDEVRLEQRLGTTGLAPTLWRIRYFDIQPDRFSWEGDRSSDGGRSWVGAYHKIEARRIGPPRSLEVLRPGREHVRPTP